MKAVILAGGLGTRLRSVLPESPKVMARVANKPFLEFHIRYLKKFNIEQIICCLGYKAEQIMDYFKNGDQWGVDIRYVVEDHPLGTAGALKNAGLNEPFIGMNGDSFLLLDIKALINFYWQIQAPVVTCKKANESARFGTVLFDQNQRIIKFCEKTDHPISEWINAGVYILTPDLIELIPADIPCSLEKDIFPKYIQKGLYAFPSQDYFIDIGTPESLLQAQKDFLKLTV